MKKRVLVFSLFMLIPLGVVMQSPVDRSNPLPPVEPLVTTTADIEKIAADVKLKDASVEFRYGDRRFSASLAEGRCTWHGWDVKKNTVLTVSEIPSNGRAKFAKPSIGDGLFFVLNDDTLGEKWVSEKLGIIYDLDSNDQLAGITWFPRSPFRAKRCSKYPHFSISSQLLTPAAEFLRPNFRDWDMGLSAPVAFTLRDDKELRGSIFVYYRTAEKQIAASFVRELEKYLQNILKVPAGAVDVQLGGVRDDNEIVLYTYKTSVPRPLPRPKFPN